MTERAQGLHNTRPHPAAGPDFIRQPGQNYILLSFVGPTMTQKHKDFCIKFRGAFPTQEDAQRVARQFQDSGDRFDIVVADAYEWLLCPPDYTKIADQRYRDDRLNAIMTGHDMEQQDARAKFDQRKEALQRDGLDEHLLPQEQIPEPDRDTYDYLNLPMPPPQYFNNQPRDNAL